jgi:UDP-N-acetylglucosamine 2-epimerase (non-hydrolysing)
LKKIISVVGARPNFMKVAPLHRAFRQYPDITHMIVHTGQHYDANMSKVFFENLGLPEPDVYLGIGSGSHAVQTAKVMVEFEQVLLRERPDLVIVVGDVNSTVACSLVAVKMGIRVAHVEAGLRSFDRTMPEEINRIVTDSISDYLFVSEPSGVENLKREGVSDAKVFFVGNVMIDSLVQFRENAAQSTIKSTLGVVAKEYALVTMHRPSNVDSVENLEKLAGLLESLTSSLKVVFPIHPRTKKMMEAGGLLTRLEQNSKIVLCEPLGYLDFLNLMESARVVITDSGGIQEETTFLGVPCLTMRENTERPVTVSEGTNALLGEYMDKAFAATREIMQGAWKQGRCPELWDGHAAERITSILKEQVI